MELNKDIRVTPAGERAPRAAAAGRDTFSRRLSWYWNRLRRMSVAEVGFRILRKVSIKAEQYGVPAARRIPATDLTRRTRPFVALDPGVEARPYVAAAGRILDGRFAIFGGEYAYADVPDWNRDPKTGTRAPFAFGRDLDYRDERLVGDIKHLWEINRHLELVTLAQAYRLTNDPQYLAGLRRLVESWLDQCPYPRGPNWTSALELAIRLISWSLAWQLAGGPESALFRADGGAFRDRWLAAIYRHMHFVRGNFSRFSSANNHLIGEAAGLYIGTQTWPFWTVTGRWRERARRELLREALRQNAPDGVNREQAVAYQQFVLDFLLLAGLAGRANGDDFPVEYWQRIERMLEFVAALMDVAGNVPMIGDADDGCVARLAQGQEAAAYRSLLATGAVVFTRADFKAKARAFDDKNAWLLGPAGKRKFESLWVPSVAVFPQAFPDGGYYVLGRDLESAREIRIVADAGPLGYQRIAAHGHADALAFTLSIAGAEMLVDPGTYAYHTERRWRDYFRGTAAHNTVRVDGENQSVIGGSFLWTRHARVHVVAWDSDARRDRLRAWHDGYARLADPVRHERELVFDKAARRLQVSDLIECRGRHKVECCWHFGEDVDVAVGRGGTVTARKAGHVLCLVSGRPVEAAVYRGDETRPAGWISRQFGVKRPATTVLWTCEVSGTTRLTARLQCRLAPRAGARRAAQPP